MQGIARDPVKSQMPRFSYWSVLLKARSLLHGHWGTWGTCQPRPDYFTGLVSAALEVNMWLSVASVPGSTICELSQMCSVPYFHT